jgi:hypothetical protein
MSHPFFDTDHYPWYREDAKALYRSLHQTIHQPHRIDILYRGVSDNLPKLALQDPVDVIWKKVLEELVSARLLKELLDLVLRDANASAAHDAVRAALDARDVERTTIRVPEAVQEELYESLARMRKVVPQNLDRSFVAERLYRRLNVLPPNAELITEEVLRSVTAFDCTEVVRIVVSDAPIEFKHLAVRASIQLPDEPEPFAASVKGDASADHRVFRVTLGFKGRVVPGYGTLKIRWQCVVPGSVARNDDYWVFPFLFQAPAPKMTIDLGFAEEPADVHLFQDEYDVRAGRHKLKPIPLSKIGGDVRDPSDPSERPAFVVYGAALNQAVGTYLFTWSV